MTDSSALFIIADRLEEIVGVLKDVRDKLEIIHVDMKVLADKVFLLKTEAQDDKPTSC
jgi:hypothetical protein